MSFKNPTCLAVEETCHADVFFFIFTAFAFFIERKLCALIFYRPQPILMKKSDEEFEDDEQCCSSSDTRRSADEISIDAEDNETGLP